MAFDGRGEAGSYICRLQPIRDLIHAAWFDEVTDLGISSLDRHLNSTSLLSCNCHLASAIGTTIYILSAGAHVSLNNNDALVLMGQTQQPLFLKLERVTNSINGQRQDKNALKQ